MRKRTIAVTGLAALFAVGTSVLPLKSSLTAVAADDGAAVARTAALGLETSSLADQEMGARYQSVADAMAARGLSAGLFGLETSNVRYQAISASWAGRMLTGPAFAQPETTARYQAVAEAFSGRGLAAAEPAAMLESTARYHALSDALAAPAHSAAGVMAQSTTTRFQSYAEGVVAHDLTAGRLQPIGAVAQAELSAAALAMAPLAEHETDDEEEEGGAEDEGETYESENYDYTITFDPNTWQVIDEQSGENEAGDPVDYLMLGAEFANTSFWGVTVDFRDAEECVEAMVEEISAIEGIDDAETQDDVDGDDEDASVVLDYEYTPEDGEATEFTAFLRCQAIEEEESYLQTWFDTLPTLYEDTEDAREELMDGVEVG